MGTLERREVFTHPLGSAGHLSLKTFTGTLRVKGIEGEDARVTVDYRIRAADQASAERALDTGRVITSRGSGSLEIETPDRRFSTGLAWLFGGARVTADIFVEVPWGAHIRLETMSGSIEADTLVGEQKYRTVSGEIRLWNLGGLVEAGTISGGIILDRGTELRLRANTISGRIKARAEVFHSLGLNTTSGGITVAGAFDPAGDFRAETISGGVELTPFGGVTAELRTVTGSINSDVPHRMEGSRGFWRTIVGDGQASLRVNSTSGSLRIRSAGPRAAQGPAPAGWTVPPLGAEDGTFAAAPAGAASVGAAAPAAAPVTASGAEGEPAAAVEGSSETSAATWDPRESAGEAAEVTLSDELREAELEVLQALERGEIGVDEAAERLERVRG